MVNNPPGKDTSVWIDTTERTEYPPLQADISCDVAVIGGGITGLLSAWFLQAEGLNTVLIEKKRLVEWTTGNTTAKLTSQHYLVYKYLIDEYGFSTARAYAKANEEGIDAIENLSEELDIECDFSRRDAYVYTQNSKTEIDIEEETEAARRLGLPASFERSIDLPFAVKAAIKFSGQAQFHPRKFLLRLAANLAVRNVQIYEETEATDIVTGSPNAVITKKGSVRAKYVVEATQYPFWRADIFDDAMWTKMSYALGVRLKKGAPYPQGMYITTDDPMRTIRSHPYEGGQLLIFGGESHKLEGDYDENEHYKNLLQDVVQNFVVDKVMYRWYAGDAMPYDRMPYIGEYPDAPTVYAVTGYRAWGLAWAASAAQIITAKILGEPVGWAEPFGLQRLYAGKTAEALFYQNIHKKDKH